MESTFVIVNTVCLIIIATALAMTYTRVNMVRRDVDRMSETISKSVAADLMSSKEFETLDPEIKKAYTVYISGRLFPGINKTLNDNKTRIMEVLKDEPVLNALIDSVIAAHADIWKQERPAVIEGFDQSGPATEKAVDDFLRLARIAKDRDLRR